ncbi:hypothetical protein BGZ96_004836 [Linnemannia gamsii]|uniref:Protein kinase domain-containing protein n=1 Tax=Linnemannia gamsii TaxID=64522 RepID=A0ABQ7K6C4_9FUNG|nr:hypothetical protein BGZ96_004836 [Linnemannia gamsii]
MAAATYKYEPRGERHNALTPQCKEMLAGLLTWNPAQRTTAWELQRLPFFTTPAMVAKRSSDDTIFPSGSAGATAADFKRACLRSQSPSGSTSTIQHHPSPEVVYFDDGYEEEDEEKNLSTIQRRPSPEVVYFDDGYEDEDEDCQVITDIAVATAASAYATTVVAITPADAATIATATTMATTTLRQQSRGARIVTRAPPLRPARPSLSTSLSTSLRTRPYLSLRMRKKISTSKNNAFDLPWKPKDV